MKFKSIQSNSQKAVERSEGMLKNNNNLSNIKYYKSKIKAFSLIELSIVLIIIGLLVAGITGGASLVESARIRSLINELNSYKQAVHSFYIVKNYYPGDLNGDNYIGNCDSGIGCVNEAYTSSSFPAPYDGSDEAYGIPNNLSAPFVDLYLEKVIDFQPKNVSITNDVNLAANGGIPYSRVFPKARILFYSYGNVSSAASNLFYYNMKNGSPYINIYNPGQTYRQTKFFKTIDQKIDDGLYNGGSLRASGINASGSYDTAIANKVISSDLYYNVGVK